MKGRDRIVLMVLAVIAVLGAAWVLVVSPERQEASRYDAQVSEAQSTLSTAEGSLASARSAQAQYASAYAAVVSLGKAVPASQEVPSLIYQLEKATNIRKVDFASISSTSSGTSSSGTASGAAGAAAATPATFTQMPFTFVFNGNFFNLEHVFATLNRFTLRRSASTLAISGRLLTIQSVKLSPTAATSSSQQASSAAPELTGTITATAYVLPASEALTGAPVPGAPAASPASGSGSTSSTTPAIVRLTP